MVLTERKIIERKCHNAVRRAVEKGLLIRLPCEVCGATPSEGHHEDYSKPLQVKWLCRKHHLGHHASIRPQKPRKPWPKREIRKKPVKYFAGYATLAKMRQLWKQGEMVGQDLT